MAAPKGNQFWKERATSGRKPIFTDPEVLWKVCCEYFEWVEDNPLKESKPFAFQGKVTMAEVDKMRAMTISGLCIFLDIGFQTWQDYKDRDDFSDIITRAEAIIYQQKFEGAAADLLNANIISRELGLADKKEVVATSIDPNNASDNERMRALFSAMTRADKSLVEKKKQT